MFSELDVLACYLYAHNMGKAKDISSEKKARISTLLSTGDYSEREVARREGVSRGAVRRIARLIKENIPGTSTGRTFCGRKKVTSSRDDRHIIKLATEKRTLSSRGIAKILAEEGRQISERTVRRRLYAAGLKCRRPIRKPKLTPSMKKARFQWAKRYENYSIDDWRKVK